MTDQQKSLQAGLLEFKRRIKVSHDLQPRSLWGIPTAAAG